MSCDSMLQYCNVPLILFLAKCSWSVLFNTLCFTHILWKCLLLDVLCFVQEFWLWSSSVDYNRTFPDLFMCVCVCMWRADEFWKNLMSDVQTAKRSAVTRADMESVMQRFLFVFCFILLKFSLFCVQYLFNINLKQLVNGGHKGFLAMWR